MCRALLFIALLSMASSARIRAEEDAPPDAVRVFAAGMADKPLAGLVWDADTLKGTHAETGADAEYPIEKVEVLRFPIVGEKLLAHKRREVLKIREPVRFQVAPLPDGLQFRFTIPMEAGLYFTPLVGPSGGPRRNTFRFWIGEERIHAQGRGAGRSRMNSMEKWNIAIPRGTDRDIHVELFIDRKGETCHLRVNHQHVKTWRIPTSYEENPEGGTWAVIRSGIDPQHITGFTAMSWSSRRYPDPEKTPAGHWDHIWLQNGDLLPGTVLGIGDGKVRVRLESGPEIPLPFERIREIRLASDKKG